MCGKYIIGVDGGNTKTDYFLFNIDGDPIDYVRSGTCSHEGLPGGYDETYTIMNNQITGLLSKNNIIIEDIAGAAFGLAGSDVPEQQRRLTEIIRKIGFTNFYVDNDSYLGIKAGTHSGYGVCSVNGTGTVAGGIDKNGNHLQVGGIGEIVGDMAGGSYIAKRAIRAVYDSLYRCGMMTSMAKPVMELLGINDKRYFIQAISEMLYSGKVNRTSFTKAVFYAANANDQAAIEILKDVAQQLAKSTAGCINNLEFGEDVEVVLAGSVWVKAECPIMLESYKEYMKKLTPKKCEFTLLTIPPATGAVLWALELAKGSIVNQDVRSKVIDAVVKFIRL